MLSEPKVEFVLQYRPVVGRAVAFAVDDMYATQPRPNTVCQKFSQPMSGLVSIQSMQVQFSIDVEKALTQLPENFFLQSRADIGNGLIHTDFIHLQ